MSDNDSQNQEEVKEIIRVPGKKFFISHMNGYSGKALLSELRNDQKEGLEDFEKHTFVGTLSKGYKIEMNPRVKVQDCPDGVKQVVSFERTEEFRQHILEADVIVYDLITTDPAEVDYVIKTLKSSVYETKKTLFLLSSVATWVLTPPKEPKVLEEGEEPDENAEQEDADEVDEGDEDEDGDGDGEGAGDDEDDENKPKKKKYLFFKESDYNIRVPHPKSQYMKTLETLALSSVNTQPMLKVHILCCGARYGMGEDKFYNHFKNAWLQEPKALQVWGKGDNLIPTIHIIDIARCVRRMVAEDMEHKYVFCIDRTKKPTQKRIVQAISKGIGTGQIESDLELNESDAEMWKIFLQMNIRMKTSDVFKDGEVPEDAEDPDAMAEALKFPWHCEKGVLDNIRKLNDEFNEARGLNPVKIMITGPPASGKSFYSDKLAQYYNIPRVHILELVDKAFKLAEAENEDEESFGAQIKAKIEEIKDEMVAKIEEARPETDEEPEEVDRDSLQVRLPDDILFKLLQERLNENACRNRGYVLDGFPRTYNNAQYIFLKWEIKQDEDGNDIEAPELGEDEVQTFKGYVVEKSIFPSSVIVLEGDDQHLTDRMMQLPEKMIAGTHYNPEDMERRLEAYRLANNSQVAEPSVQDFFKENQVQLFRSNVVQQPQIALESFKIYIERIEKPFNYMTFDQQIEKVRKQKIQAEREKVVVKKQEVAVMEDGLDRELKKQKMEYTKISLDAIREQQKELLDFKSQPIRQYLMDNLVPILTEALIDVCKETPEDPIDHLSEYLFKRSLDVPYPDPSTF